MQNAFPTADPRRYSCVAAIALFLGVLGGALSWASAEEAAPVTAKPERIVRLIGQLGSDEFTIREAAGDELTRIGLPAFADLEAAAKNPDREIRYRSQRILGLIRQLDMQRRLEAFLAAKDDGEGYELPGWSRFRKSYGDDSQSRALFVDMQRADPDLMRALDEGPRTAADALGQRTSQFQQSLQLGLQQASIGQIAATLFVAAEEDVALSTQTMTLVLNHCFQQTYREALTNSPRRELPRKMLGSIIRRSDGQAAYTAINVAYQLNLSEGIDPAVKILNNPVQPYMIPHALMLVAKSGDSAHLPIVEKLLENKTVVTRIQEGGKDQPVMYELQVRDSALACAVLLSKQELRTFFDGAQPQQITDLQQVFFNARMIGFTGDDMRAKVFDKWTKYRASQPKTETAAKPQP